MFDDRRMTPEAYKATENNDELKALKVVMKALNVKYKVIMQTPYNSKFIAKKEKGEKEFSVGDYTTITLDEIWK